MTLNEDTLTHRYLDTLEEIVAVAVTINPADVELSEGATREQVIYATAQAIVALGRDAATAEDIISTEEPTA